MAGQNAPECKLIKTRSHPKIVSPFLIVTHFTTIDLSWSCHSIGSSKDLFDFLIFHENNEFIQKMKCPKNVIRINLGKDGIGSLISSALVRDVGDDPKLLKLKTFIPTVLQKFPYFLAEFKTGVCLPLFLSHTHC
jgi:hypothetical protein